MKLKNELPLVEPLYSTFHYQGESTGTLASNLSIRNWYLNQILTLSCSKKFLNGYTSPELTIEQTSWYSNPYITRVSISVNILKSSTNNVIRNMIDEGYYVCFRGVDDYYIKGKTWYHERHFCHDGCICGYNQEDKTFCIYAYDQNWLYKKFWTPQKCFTRGRKSKLFDSKNVSIIGIKPKQDKVEFSAQIALRTIQQYLDSTSEKYKSPEIEKVYGFAVHDFLIQYIDKLYDGSIPYEKLDRRILRLIWEHKKVMLERIVNIENQLNLNSNSSINYKHVVDESNEIRILYALYHKRRRDSLLVTIKAKLIDLSQREQNILRELVSLANYEKEKK